MTGVRELSIQKFVMYMFYQVFTQVGMWFAKGMHGRNTVVDGESSRRCGQKSKGEGWDI